MNKLNMNHVAGIILGGGKGTRLFPLTKERSKPAVPLGGKYRLVDIPVSNCINSGIKKIFVITQFNSESLNRSVYETINSTISQMDIFVSLLLNRAWKTKSGCRELQMP